MGSGSNSNNYLIRALYLLKAIVLEYSFTRCLEGKKREKKRRREENANERLVLVLRVQERAYQLYEYIAYQNIWWHRQVEPS